MPHERRRARSASRKDEVVQIRMSAKTKAMLNRAAMLGGQKLSEFVLESARRRAEETFLDQRTFFLLPGAHATLLAMLDNPAKPTRDLHARMNCKPSWTR